MSFFGCVVTVSLSSDPVSSGSFWFAILCALICFKISSCSLITLSWEVFENFDSISIMYSEVYGIHVGLFFEAELSNYSIIFIQ